MGDIKQKSSEELKSDLLAWIEETKHSKDAAKRIENFHSLLRVIPEQIKNNETLKAINAAKGFRHPEFKKEMIDRLQAIHKIQVKELKSQHKTKAPVSEPVFYGFVRFWNNKPKEEKGAKEKNLDKILLRKK